MHCEISSTCIHPWLTNPFWRDTSKHWPSMLIPTLPFHTCTISLQTASYLLPDEKSKASGSKPSTASQSLMLAPTGPAAYQTPPYTWPPAPHCVTNKPNQTNKHCLANQTNQSSTRPDVYKAPHFLPIKQSMPPVACIPAVSFRISRLYLPSVFLYLPSRQLASLTLECELFQPFAGSSSSSSCNSTSIWKVSLNLQCTNIFSNAVHIHSSVHKHFPPPAVHKHISLCAKTFSPTQCTNKNMLLQGRAAPVQKLPAATPPLFSYVPLSFPLKLSQAFPDFQNPDSRFQHFTWSWPTSTNYVVPTSVKTDQQVQKAPKSTKNDQHYYKYQ